MVTSQGTNRYLKNQHSLIRTDESFYLDGFRTILSPTWPTLNEIQHYVKHSTKHKTRTFQPQALIKADK